jgi:hypothetical protein
MDEFNATWESPHYSHPEIFEIIVPIVRPASEQTSFSGWDTDGLGQWTQTLYPPHDDPNFKFAGEFVQEYAADPAGPDTCWFPGSATKPNPFKKYISISGGPVGGWEVKKGNIWGFDHVGWYRDPIKYYRAQGRAPCGTEFGQQMKIKSEADTGFRKYEAVNILGGKILRHSVVSIRDGQSASR